MLARRILWRPWVTGLLVLVLFLDACTLDVRTVVGDVMSELEVPFRPRYCSCHCGCFWAAVSGLFVERDGALQVDFSRSEREEYLGYAAGFVCDEPGGFWAVTSCERSVTLEMVFETERIASTEEAARIRRQLADELETYPDEPDAAISAQMLRSDAAPVRRVIWFGYLHNVFSLLLAVSACYSLGWIYREHAWRRRAQAIRRGWCPRCGYELCGDVAAGCPECGWRRPAQDSPGP